MSLPLFTWAQTEPSAIGWLTLESAVTVALRDNPNLTEMRERVSTQSNDNEQLIVDTAHINSESGGLVCIVPANDLLWIHDKRSATDNDFQLHT